MNTKVVVFVNVYKIYPCLSRASILITSSSWSILHQVWLPLVVVILHSALFSKLVPHLVSTVKHILELQKRIDWTCWHALCRSATTQMNSIKAKLHNFFHKKKSKEAAAPAEPTTPKTPAVNNLEQNMGITATPASNSIYSRKRSQESFELEKMIGMHRQCHCTGSHNILGPPKYAEGNSLQEQLLNYELGSQNDSFSESYSLPEFYNDMQFYMTNFTTKLPANNSGNQVLQ